MPVQDSSLILAVDIGGTKTAVGLVSRSGEILDAAEENTCQNGPQESAAQISRLADLLLLQNRLERKAVRCAGVGIPAVLEAETDLVIWAPNLQGWRQVALRPMLEAGLGLPVFIEYDGHAAVLGEWWVGAGRGYASIVDVIIGTGIGGGMILDGQLIRGRDRLAGAAGWFTFTTPAGAADGRSRSLGFWESAAAGPGIALRAQALLPDHPDSLLWELNRDGPIAARQVFKAAQQGDTFALQIAQEFAGWIGLGLANITSLVNPEIIILGGGVGSACDFLLHDIQEVVQKWAQPVSAAHVTITTSKLGLKAGLLGAAYGALLRFEGRKNPAGREF